MRTKKILLVGALSLVLVLGIAIPVAQAALTETQITAILSLLNSFGADKSVIENVSASLRGLPTQGGGGNTSSICAVTNALYLGIGDGDTDGDVTLLQQFLGVSPTTGFFGPKTLLAVQNWQAANGVVSSGTPDTTGYGVVGPKTLSAMQKSAGCGGSTSATLSATPTSGPAPLTVYFQGSGSVLAQSAGISFGDGTMTGEGVTSVSHTYYNPGTYTASLHKDGAKGEVVATATITATQNQALPSLTILSNLPANGSVDVALTLPKQYDGDFVLYIINPVKTSVPVSSGALFGTTYYLNSQFNLLNGQNSGVFPERLSLLSAHEGFASNSGGVHWFPLPSGKYKLTAVIYPKSPFKPGTEMEYYDVGQEPPALGFADSSEFELINPTTPGGITVTAPNGGEKLPLNGNSYITWKETGLGTVDIALYKNDQWLGWINNNVTPDGQVSWNPSGYRMVTENYTAGDVFKIYITGRKADGTGYVEDKSDAPFGFTSSTVAGGRMSITVGINPVAQTIVPGAQQFTFANYQLSAVGSGEDIRVSGLSPIFRTNAQGTLLTSCQLFDGLVALNTGYRLLNTIGPAASYYTIGFDAPIIVAKGTIKTLALKCNISSTALAGNYFQWGIDSGYTPSAPWGMGVTSGQPALTTIASSPGPLMTIAGGGTTPTVRVTYPNNGETITKGVGEPFQLKLTATNVAPDNNPSSVYDACTDFINAITGVRYHVVGVSKNNFCTPASNVPDYPRGWVSDNIPAGTYWFEASLVRHDTGVQVARDLSDKTFILAPATTASAPTVRVTYPNNGETITTGGSQALSLNGTITKDGSILSVASLADYDLCTDLISAANGTRYPVIGVAIGARCTPIANNPFVRGWLGTNIPAGSYYAEATLIKHATGEVVSTDRSDGPFQLVVGTTTGSPGTLSVSADASAPSYQIVAGGQTGVTLGVLKFTATGEAIKLDKIAFQITKGSGADLYNNQITIWDGGTQVGSSVFSGTSKATLSTLASSVVIPKDGVKVLTVKGDIADIGTSQPGTEGDLLAVDYDNDYSTGTQGTGQNSGSTITRTSTSDTAFAGVRMFNTYPTITKLPLPSTTLSNGVRSLLRFSIAAAPQGPVGIARMTLSMSLSGATVSGLDIYCYTDSTFSSPCAGLSPDGGFNTSDRSVTSSASSLQFSPLTASGITTMAQVSPGGVRYFDVRGTVAGAASGSSISTQLQGDAAYPIVVSLMGTVAQIGGDPNSDFIWSPDAVNTAAPTDSDWTNGYGVPGLPASSISDTLAIANSSFLGNVWSAFSDIFR
ncbi:MAG TPA: PKD domain-containing protein [Candidatus Paceibacterota bacterium]